MRLSSCSAVLVALVSLPLIGCGGDDEGGGVMVPDAKVFMDAPPAQNTCEIPASVQGGSLGSDTMRQSDDWVYKPAQGPFKGKTVFSVSVPIDQGQTDFVTFIAVKNGATWTTNAPINFETNPTNLAAANAVAIIDQNLNAQTGASDKTLWASSGSITFSEIDQTANAKITFTGTANFREIDDQGADVAGGCTSMLGTVQVFLQQKTAVSLVAPQNGQGWRHVLLDNALIK